MITTEILIQVCNNDQRKPNVCRTFGERLTTTSNTGIIEWVSEWVSELYDSIDAHPSRYSKNSSWSIIDFNIAPCIHHAIVVKLKSDCKRLESTREVYCLRTPLNINIAQWMDNVDDALYRQTDAKHSLETHYTHTRTSHHLLCWRAVKQSINHWNVI